MYIHAISAHDIMMKNALYLVTSLLYIVQINLKINILKKYKKKEALADTSIRNIS